MSQSSDLFSLAKQYIPGGVNSPVRSFNGVGGTPIFFSRGAGAYLYDEDNHQYIDYVSSWGPLILGHCHPTIVNAAEKALHEGMSFGAPTKLEVTMAELVCRLVPSIEMVRMVNSGTEATMSAIRLARGYTGRNKIIKFIGCYHGHADSLLVKAGSGLLTFSIPGSPGVPEDFVKHTLTVHFNQLDEVEKLFKHHKNDIACIIVEPVACNMNCVLPQPGFLQGLRKLCDEYKSVLIFDEVITGFRLALGGAQEYFGVTPDLTTLGKIIGGGMPVGAYGGKREIMEQLAPLGPVYQAGTLSGNPVAMAAGIATLTELQRPDLYKELERKTTMLLNGLNECAKANGIPLHTQQVQSIFGLFFTDKHHIQNYDDTAQCNIDRFKKFFHAMLQEGIYLAPSAYEAGFISAAHSEKDIEETIKAADRVFKNCRLG